MMAISFLSPHTKNALLFMRALFAALVFAGERRLSPPLEHSEF